LQKSEQESTIQLLQSKIKKLKDRLDVKNPAWWGLKRESCEIQFASKVNNPLQLQYVSFVYQFSEFSGFEQLGKISRITGPQHDSRYDV